MNRILRLLRRDGGLHRGVTLFFLLLIVSDLSLPQICCREFGCSEQAGAVAGPAGAHGDSILLSMLRQTLLVEANSEQGEGSPGETDEHDCSCSCSNFIPGQGLFTGLLSAGGAIPASAHLGLPVSPPADPFHPPRLS
ncbi:MAG TPA: hypothetical protein VJ302_19635 [Blastocatellia bacterium]|nr:hypothetical protein [Blastocatellia bacterium]